MKVYDRIGTHVKTVPVRYKAIDDITDYLSDFEHKRLSKCERQGLEAILLWFTLPLTIKNVVNVNDIKEARRVTTRDGVYYVVVFGRYEVRCNYKVYSSMPIKKRIKRLC